jgi:iron(III) transport system ATP-binding protein
MAELRCEHVAASYGSRTVLRDVDLVVPEGTLTAVLGASGSGKTTLLRVVMGFTRAEQGSVVVGGSIVADGRIHVPPEKRGIGYVAQEGALYPHLNVGANVAFGLPRSERRTSARVGDVLELVGLGRNYADRRPHQLSGGEQRRVSLARALAPRPRVVLLDEPFSGLDAALRAETRAAVLQALADEKTTAVLVTHDQAEALSMGRQVAVLRDGRLVQCAPPSVLYTSPIDLEVARFVGEAVVVTGRAKSGTVVCALGDLRVADAEVEGQVSVMIRPEQIRLLRSSPSESRPSASACAPIATVVDRSYLGPETVVRVSLEGVEEPVLARMHSHQAPEVGVRVSLEVAGPVVVYPAEATSPPLHLAEGTARESRQGTWR